MAPFGAAFPAIIQIWGDEAGKKYWEGGHDLNAPLPRYVQYDADGSSVSLPPTKNQLTLESMRVALIYAAKEFEGIAKLINELSLTDGSQSFPARFEILDGGKLKRLAKKINVDTSEPIVKQARKKSPRFRFSENPPQIIWDRVIILIPPSSIQLCVCRVAFGRQKGEEI